MAATTLPTSRNLASLSFLSPRNGLQCRSFSLSPLSNPSLFKIFDKRNEFSGTGSFLASQLRSTPVNILAAASPALAPISSDTFRGLCHVVGDNIDADQIIPAEFLTLDPSNPEEFEKLGCSPLPVLPSAGSIRLELGESKSKHSILIAGNNFGCGSFREQAPAVLHAAGITAVVAESYASDFLRNSVATGGVYPLESVGRIRAECRTGDEVTIEVRQSRLINHTTGKQYKLRPIGVARPVTEYRRTFEIFGFKIFSFWKKTEDFSMFAFEVGRK